MSWTHRIAKDVTVVDDLRLSVDVEFIRESDGATRIVPFVYSEPGSLKALIANQIAQYEKIDSAKASLPKAGDVLVVVDVPKVDTVPQEQLDAHAFAAADAAYQSVLLLVQKGYITPDDALVKVLAAAAKDAFVPVIAAMRTAAGV